MVLWGGCGVGSSTGSSARKLVLSLALFNHKLFVTYAVDSRIESVRRTATDGPWCRSGVYRHAGAWVSKSTHRGVVPHGFLGRSVGLYGQPRRQSSSAESRHELRLGPGSTDQTTQHQAVLYITPLPFAELRLVPG